MVRQQNPRLIERKFSPTMQKAQDLFLSEYDDPRSFYKHFESSADIYMEIAHRVVAIRLGEKDEQLAYRTMYEAYMNDAQMNNSMQLDELIFDLVADTALQAMKP